MKKYLLSLVLLVVPLIGYSQTTYISVTGGGNWNSASTWDVDFDNSGGDGIPGANDIAIVIGDGAGGGTVNITSNVSVGDLFVVTDNANVLSKAGLPFNTFTLTINGQLSGILSDLSNIGVPSVTVIENDARLNIVFTNDNSSTPNITSWGHTSALRNVTINPTLGVTTVEFDDVAIHTSLDIDNGALQVNSGTELIDGTSSSTITVASGSTLSLVGDINGNGTNTSRFNSLVINGTMTTGVTAYVNATNFTVGSTGAVNVNYNNNDGTGQDEGWWFETNSPSTFGIDAGSTFTYGANQSQNIAPITYGNLTLSASTGLRTKTLNGTGTFNVAGDLTIANVSTELASLVTTELQLKGDVTNNGTWTTSANQDIRFNGSSTQTIGGNNSIVFNDAVFAANTLVFETDITFESTFTDNDNDLSFSEDFTFNGTSYDQGIGTITFDGASQQIAGSGDINFEDITLSNSTLANNATNASLSGLLSMSSSSFDADGGGAGSFTLISDANGTASVGNLTGSAVSGNWTVQRYFDGAGDVWRNFGVGVSGATVANITGSGFTINGNDLAHYDETEIALGTVDDGWVTQSDFGSNLSNTRGYSMWTRDTEVTNTVEFTGTLNTGNRNMTVSRTTGSVSAANDGWNLVNNPFASTIDWDLLNASNLDGTVSVWNTSTSTYDTWNGSTGSLTNGLIASGQAFWVHSSSGSPTLTIQEADKVTTSTSFLKTEEEPLFNHLIVKLIHDDKIDRAYIHFRSDATDNYDTQFDGRKLSNGIYNLSSKAASGESLAINSMGDITACNKMVELNITNIEEGNYDLIFEDLLSFTTGFDITLVDNFLSTSQVLEEGASYNFDVMADIASFGDTRFELEFTAATLETNLSTSTINNCDQEFISINIDNSQIGVEYNIMSGAEIVATDTGNGGQVALQISKSLLVEGTNTYEVNIDNGECGSAIADSPISVDYVTLLVVSEVQDGSNCGTGSITLTAGGATTDGYYYWYESLDAIEPIVDQSAASFNTPELGQSKTYFVSVVNSQGCESSIRVPVNATINELPQTPNITLEGDILVSSAKENNQWYKDDVLIEGATDNIYEVDESGSYSVTVENSSGCKSSSEARVMAITAVLEDDFNNNILKIYPNPIGDEELTLSANELSTFKIIQLYNNQGMLMLTKQIGDKSEIQIDMNGFSKGIYFIHFKGESGTTVHKLLKN